jgi:hypothetical protein
MKATVEKLLATTAPDLGPGPRAGVLGEKEIRQAMASESELLLALVLLWHDHHEPAHEISQAIENADGSYVHAILHRREPDYWNSKYWFRRVAVHPAYAELGRRVSEFLESRGERALAAKLVPAGRWDAMGFVDACEAAAKDSGERAALLKEVQRIEFETLAEHLSGE